MSERGFIEPIPRAFVANLYFPAVQIIETRIAFNQAAFISEFRSFLVNVRALSSRLEVVSFDFLLQRPDFVKTEQIGIPDDAEGL
jgi:hypothetical protein